MNLRMYEELSKWYRLLTPASEYVEEAAIYRKALFDAVPNATTFLELGAGAGHNAVHLKAGLACTLTDLSASMIELSKEINPECEHVVSDMRTLRLGRTFDLVFIHDAIAYMTTEADLAKAIETAFLHTRPGGVTLFAPDFVRETFNPCSDIHGVDEPDGKRGLRCIEWCWDPDPTDDTYVADYAFMYREGNEMQVEHDRHIEGLFSRSVWRKLLENAGFEVELVRRDLEDWVNDEMFLARRPAG